MDRWYWTASSLLPGEVSKGKCSCKRLYDGDQRTGYEDGTLTVTNVRLLWKHSSQAQSLGLLHSVIALLEEEAGGFISSPKLVLHLTPATPDQPTGPISSSPHSFIKLSMKQSDLSSCVTLIQMALTERAWETNQFRNMFLTHPLSTSSKKQPRAGILGIERAMEAKQHAASQSISVAFEDMKQLMKQAKDMVALSHNIAARIKDQGHEATLDETTQFRSCLLSLGIDDPVTREAVGSVSEYHRKLAQEISQALLGPVTEAGGVMLLSEAYCRINRARGLQLLSPEDLANACSQMAKLGLPLELQSFESGVQVLQLSRMDTNALVESFEEVLSKECTVGSLSDEDEGTQWKGLTAGEIARLLGLPLLLVKERLALCEKHGKALRDESNEGVLFYPNYFDQLS